jgi:Na+-transporting methylmalonyl-CoA/oxaloacetate decarboxylase gamma subunit
MTPEQYDARLRYWIGILLALTLVGIVGSVLYSLIFVTQPMNGQAPNDAEFFKLISPIANFIVGALSGVMASAVSSAIKKPEPPPQKEPTLEEPKDASRPA